VPIGPKNIFGNGNRKNLLKRLVGEVHIVSRDVQPDPKAKIFALEANARLLTPAIALLICAACIYSALSLRSGELGIFVARMLHSLYFPGVFAAVQDVVEPSLRGTAMSVYFFGMYLLGGSFGPVLTGKLSHYFTRRAIIAAGASVISEPFRAAGLHNALYVIPLFTMVVVAVLFAASFTVEGDMRALQRWMDEPAARLSLQPTPLEQSSD